MTPVASGANPEERWVASSYSDEPEKMLQVSATLSRHLCPAVFAFVERSRGYLVVGYKIKKTGPLTTLDTRELDSISCIRLTF